MFKSFAGQVAAFAGVLILSQPLAIGGEESCPPPRVSSNYSDPIMRCMFRETLANVKVDRSYDIPGLVTHGAEPGTVYIDRGQPQTLKLGSYTLDIDLFLSFQIQVERAMTERLGVPEALAEAVALLALREAMRAAGLSFDEYAKILSADYAGAAHRGVHATPSDAFSIKPRRLAVSRRPLDLSDQITAVADFLVSREIVNRDFDIPYAAGFSMDGKTIYIDREMSDGYSSSKSGRKSVHVSAERFLVLHEALEKAVLDQFGFLYQYAHQFALRFERVAVQAANLDLEAYENFMEKSVRRAGAQPILLVPRDLDLKPYVDEGDVAILGAIQALILREQGSGGQAK